MKSSHPPSDRGPYGGDRWSARPVLALVVRCSIVIVPVVASLAATLAARLILPLPGSPLGRAVWFVVMLALAVITAAVAERAMRKALPIATLLRMSMLFPDRAPTRFQVARKAWSARGLRRLATDTLSPGAAEQSAPQAATSVLALVTALSAHDRRTRGHAERVRIFADMLAEQVRLPEQDRDRLRWAALLHDIGKLTVTSRILNKPGRLDPAEWELMKAHPLEGARIAEPLMAWLGPWGRTIAEHHERSDGAGYPAGLSGGAISVGARLVSVVDAYDTMTAARPYRRPVATRKAREELARCAGAQFDPVMVREFLAISVPRLVWVSGPASFLVHVPYLWELQRAAGQAAVVMAQTAAAGAIVTAAAVTVTGPLATPPHRAGGTGPNHITTVVASGQTHRTGSDAGGPGGGPGKGNGGGQGKGGGKGNGGGQGKGKGQGSGQNPGGSQGGGGVAGGGSQGKPSSPSGKPVSKPTSPPAGSKPAKPTPRPSPSANEAA